MIEEKPNSEISWNSYLKQYTCSIFNQLLTSNYQPTKTATISFPTTNPIQNLPHHYHDLTSDRLYLLKWTNKDEKIILQILQIVTDKHQPQLTFQVQFDYPPQHLALVSGLMYFVGAGYVYIVDMDYTRTRDIMIERVSYEYVESVWGVLQENESSLIMYCRDSKKNLFVHQIVPNSSGTQSWLSKLSLNGIKSLFSNQTSDFQDFQVLIPKVLGIVISNNNTFFLINLNTFQIIPNTITKLTGWAITNPKSLIVRLKNLPHDQKHDDSIMLCLADSHCAELFILKINLHQGVSLPPQSNYRLTLFPNQSIVDWERFSIQSNLTICHNQEILLDLEFVKKGLVICGLKNVFSRVPNYSFYCQNQYYMEGYTILTQELPLWKDYTENNKNLNRQSLIDRLLMPNRYSLQFINFTCGVSDLSHLKPEHLSWKKIIFSWHKTFKFIKMVMLKGEFLILRQHSLSVLLPISPMQYSRQQFQFSKFQAQFDRNEQNLNHFQPDMSDSMSNMSLQQQNQSYLVENMETGHLKDPAQDEQDFLELALQIYSSIYERSHQTVPSTNFIKKQNSPDPLSFGFPHYLTTLLSNRIKDLLLYYTSTLLKLIRIFECQPTKYTLSFIYRQPLSPALRFYHYLLTQSLNFQYFTFKKDIFTTFIIEQISRKVTGNLESDVKYTIGLLFKGIIPQKEHLTMVNIGGRGSFQKSEERNTFLEMITKNYNNGFEEVTIEIIKVFFQICQNNKYIPIGQSTIGILGIMDKNIIKKIFIRYLLTCYELDEIIIPKLKVWNKQTDQIYHQLILICAPQLLHKNITDANLNILFNKESSKGMYKIIKKNIENIEIPEFNRLEGCATGNVEHIIASTIQRLKFIQSTDKLLHFQSIVFKFRCSLLQTAIQATQPKDKDAILKLLYKARAALITYIQYYQINYNVRKEDFNQQQLFGCEYLLGDIRIMNKWATTKWIDLLQKFITKYDGFETENFQDIQALDKELSYCLVVEAFQKQDKNLLSLLINFYGCFYLDQIIGSNATSKTQYVQMQNNKIKAMLQYAKINFQSGQRSEDIVKQFHYRNAHIEASLQGTSGAALSSSR